LLPAQLPLFVTAAEAGSFSAAARRAGVSPAAVSKGIARLERTLGVRLFHRTTHSLSLTEDGAALLRRITPLLSELESSLEGISDRHEQPTGRVKVNLPDSFGRECVLPLLGGFLSDYPGIELDLHFDDRVRDLVAEGFDVGIGNRINEDSRLIARPLHELELVTVASRRYVALHGRPATPDDLPHHDCIAYRSMSTGRRVPWRFTVDGEERPHIPRGRLVVSNIAAAKDAMTAGLGITTLGRWHVDAALSAGDVVPVLQDYQPPPSTVWVYYPSRRQVPLRTRLLVEHLIREFGR
jgi:DNA-binding transcriptional LysR family regulator